MGEFICTIGSDLDMGGAEGFPNETLLYIVSCCSSISMPESFVLKFVETLLKWLLNSVLIKISLETDFLNVPGISLLTKKW